VLKYPGLPALGCSGHMQKQNSKSIWCSTVLNGLAAQDFTS